MFFLYSVFVKTYKRAKQMKLIICETCGANDWENHNGYMICKYCRQKYVPTASDTAKQTSIALNSDIEALLQKCKTDPKNAKKYANLILDIDPSNPLAIRYL